MSTPRRRRSSTAITRITSATCGARKSSRRTRRSTIDVVAAFADRVIDFHGPSPGLRPPSPRSAGRGSTWSFSPRAGEGARSADEGTLPDTIIQREMASTRAYDTLEYLTDNIGPRLSGSSGAAAAVKWATAQFRAWGIPVTNETVMVPHWVRGEERATLPSHRNQKIVLTALGGSAATPAQGITAD